jgi:5'-deoxynucleotidase YfbR-like HD superfamily hydrolase
MVRSEKEVINERLEMLRRAGNVERMHCVRPLIQTHYNVAEHTFHAMCIAMELCRLNLLQPGRVLARLLYHDVPEVETGDIPANVKRAAPELEVALRGIEKGFKDKWDLHAPEAAHFKLQNIPGKDAHELELAIYKAADYLELGWFCLTEKRMGNRNFKGGQSIQRVFENVTTYMVEYGWIPGVNDMTNYLKKEWLS